MGNDGVQGVSDTGFGVRGISQGGPGVHGESTADDGVQGISTARDHSGVHAINSNGGRGLTAAGTPAGHFDGNVEVTGALNTDTLLANGVSRFEGNVAMLGDITCSGNIIGNQNAAKTTITCFDVLLGGGDCAEDFDVHDEANVEAGMVMVIDKLGALRACDESYDKKVAGVISGAGDYKPGIILDKRDSGPNRKPVALFGKVHCKVDANLGAIEVGDLLTTSPTRGHAMKAQDPLRAFGAVIGKAMGALVSGRGSIPILLTLQ
jgi:hypothetical protein